MNSPTSVDDDPSPPPFHPTCVQTPSSKKPTSLHKPGSQKAERPVVQFGASNGGCFALHTRAGWGFGPPSDRTHTMNKHETSHGQPAQDQGDQGAAGGGRAHPALRHVRAYARRVVVSIPLPNITTNYNTTQSNTTRPHSTTCDIHLPELQEDPTVIAIEKTRLAAQYVGAPGTCVRRGLYGCPWGFRKKPQTIGLTVHNDHPPSPDHPQSWWRTRASASTLWAGCRGRT